MQTPVVNRKRKAGQPLRKRSLSSRNVCDEDLEPIPFPDYDSNEDETVEESSANIQITPSQKKRKISSPIWEYFTKSEDQKSRAVCNVCKTMIATNNGATTMLYKHLEKDHNKIYSDKILEQVNEKKAEVKKRKEEREILEMEKGQKSTED